MSFSIIIPHFNSTVTLEQLLESIPTNQENIQTIVIDDCSSNEEKQRLRELYTKFPKVEFYENSTNRGAGYCRNEGLVRATNDWILFADSDDMFSKNLYKLITSYDKSKSDIIFFPPASFSESKLSEGTTRHLTFLKLVGDYNSLPNKKNKLRLLYFFVVPWSKMIRKSLITDNNIKFEEISLSNDLLFSARSSYYANEIEVANEKIYLVRMSTGSMTTKISEERYLKRLEAWIDYVVFLRNNLSKEDFRLLQISGMHKIIEIIRYRFGLKTFGKTVKLLWKYKIRVIDTRIFNFPFLFRKIFFYKKIWRNDRKFISKE